MAKNTIKGLTVEIGGDTTKLGKALADVDKKSRDLSGELGQINKLLKLDPGNTELLAQKQKVLGEAVENTKDKLDKLKKAEKQVQEQFEKGEVSEEQVRELKREIIKTEKEMDGYEKEIKETAKGLDKMDDSTKKVEKSSDGLGSKLGSLAKGGVKLLAAGVAATAGALIASAEATRDYRTEMGKLDTAFTTAGHNSEAAKNTYKALQGVLGETDQAVEAANHLAKLTNNEQDLQKWTDICTGVYATFGASLPIEGLTEAANETAKVGKVTGPLADALNWAGVSEDAFNESLAACSTEQERQTLIMETLNGIYDDAANKYKETNAEVIRANQANEEWMSSMAEIGGVIEPILTDVKLMGASLLSDLVPGIKEVAGAFRGMLNGDDEAAANLGEALSGIFTQLLNKITGMLPAVAQMASSLITTFAVQIIQAVPQLIQTLGQVVLSLVQAITDAIPILTGALVQNIPLIVQAALSLFMGLVEAIPKIIPPLMEAIPQLVTAIVEALVMALPGLIYGAVEFLMAIVEAIPQVIPPLIAAIPQIVNTLVNGLLNAIPVLIQGAIKLLNAIIQAIPQIIPPLIAAIPQIINTLVNGLVQAVPQLVEGAITLLNAIVKAIPMIIQVLIPKIPTIVTSIVNGLLKMSPVLVQAAVDLFMALVKAIPEVVSALIQNLPQILKAITSVLSGGVKLVFNIGKDLIKGLWNGIKDMTSWVIDKIKGFGENILSGIKSFFGIKSPSRVFRDQVGKMLTEGLAIGIEDNADRPLDAMTDLSNDLLGEADQMNGLTLERRVAHTFAAPTAPTMAESGMLGKLDRILAAIERGQVLTINGDTLVGATAGKMDGALGRRRVLAARGAV